ncbi:ATP-binding protein, partial [Bacillus cereus]|nr:ATP-binding protein [Bacillus cereus]
HFNIYKQKVQMYDIQEDTKSQLTPKTEEKEKQFITPIDRIELMGERNRLKQLFLNIVQNSIKYSHKKRKINIEATKIEEKAVIKVSDEGIGSAK